MLTMILWIVYLLVIVLLTTFKKYDTATSVVIVYAIYGLLFAFSWWGLILAVINLIIISIMKNK